jgi:outer membrane protein OmpA-like peptidoglycan-associated protein
MEDFIFISLAFIVMLAIYPTEKPPLADKVAIILGDKSCKKNAITIGSNGEKVKVDKPLMKVKIKEDGALSNPVKISEAELNKNFGDVINAIPKKAFATNIFFTKGIKLTDDYIMRIFQIKNEIKRREPCEVDISGFSDAKGTKEENLIISKKRAELIKNLIDETKVNIKSVNLRAFGESRQLVSTKDNIYELKNRRVEIIIK